MCGIAGIIGALDDTHRAALARMNAAMAHRGPDAEGVWESTADAGGWGAMLAHRRLSILDLSPAGAQPMVEPRTGDCLVYNGELYNFREVRAGFPGEGREITSSGDTAVLLHALVLRGKDALPALRGMFAFAFWSARDRELLLARDPLGMKPLYVARGPAGGRWSLAFASELRALLASGLLGTPRLHPDAAASVAWNGFVCGPETAVEGVGSLGPGEWSTYDARGRPLAARRYWTVPPHGAEAAGTEEGLAEVLQEGLRLHLASDVPLAVFLSSGVDSSAVANLAQRASPEPVHTFTLAFEEAAFDEGPHAERIARAIGSRHRQVVLTEADFVAHLDAALDSLDQPTFDGVNSWFLSRAIREAGFKVALVGTGGDELFGGYTSFRDLPLLHRWLRHVPRGPRAALAGLLARAASLRHRGKPVPPQTRWAKLPEMARQGADLLALYQLAYALFLPDFQDRLLGTRPGDRPRDGLPAATRSALERESAGRSPLSAISVFEQRLFLGERLLRDNDVASMAASIEQRLPLVDAVLLAYASRLPDDVRYHPVRRKAILRRVGLRGLDPALFERPKSGFVLPFDRWMRARLGRRMDETLRDPEAARRAGLRPEAVRQLWTAFLAGAPGMYWSRIWAIYALIRWCHANGVYR